MKVEEQLARLAILVKEHNQAEVVFGTTDGDSPDGAGKRKEAVFVKLMQNVTWLSQLYSTLEPKAMDVIAREKQNRAAQNDDSDNEEDASSSGDSAKLNEAAMSGRKKKKKMRKNSLRLPPLRPMRTGCGDYGAAEAVKRLVSSAQDKLFEPDANGLLNAVGRNGGGGGTAMDNLRMDRGLSELDAALERALDHIETTWPKVVEKWARWFAEDGAPVEAPMFSPDAEPHVSEKVGRKLFEQAVKNGDL